MRRRVWGSAPSREKTVALDHQQKAKARQLPTEHGRDKVPVIPADADGYRGAGPCAHAQRATKNRPVEREHGGLLRPRAKSDHSETGSVANTYYPDETEEAGLVPACDRLLSRFRIEYDNESTESEPFDAQELRTRTLCNLPFSRRKVSLKALHTRTFLEEIPP